MDINKIKLKLKGLEEALDRAIDSENYESAADIREDIDKAKAQIVRAENKQDRNDKKDELESKFDEITEKHSEFTPESFFPDNSLPNLGETVEVFDYEGAFDDLKSKARRVVEIMVMSIFNNDKEVFNDPIVKEKMKDDIDIYADLKFAAEMTRRLFMNGLKDLDNGAQSSRMYEVVSKMQTEMRNNNKMLQVTIKDMNKSYRILKEDLAERLMSEEEEENTNIQDMKGMNNMIKDFLEEKEKKRIEEKRKRNISQIGQEDEDMKTPPKKDDDSDETEENKKGDN